MAELKLPGDDEKKKKEVSFARFAIWIIVGGIAVYMILSGIIGGLAKGNL